ncbi:MAG: PEGA domain-containing protein, partial [Pseudomonadota bacterium]
RVPVSALPSPAEVGSAGAPEPPPAVAAVPIESPVEPPVEAPPEPAAPPEVTQTPKEPVASGGTTSPGTPASSEPASMGVLMVNSAKPGQVMVDGKVLGPTPLSIPFPQGTYTVVVLGDGGELCRQQATVSSRPKPVLCRPAAPTGGQRDDDEHHQR